MIKRFFLSERNILLAIFLNAVVIFFMYFPEFRKDPRNPLEFIDHLFLLFFVAEALVKMNVLKPRAYFGNGWNRFDFFIVMVSFPSILTPYIDLPNTSLLIILRLFRLVRLIRFIRFVPNIGQIMAGLGRALRASVFVLAALVFLDFLLAIITCHFYGDIAPQYFGDPLVSAYSIFQLFTVEGWNDIPASITSGGDLPVWVIGATRFYFVLVVLLGGIFGMSLANAVFVDEMTIDNTRVVEEKIDRLEAQILELKEMLRQGRN